MVPAASGGNSNPGQQLTSTAQGTGKKATKHLPSVGNWGTPRPFALARVSQFYPIAHPGSASPQGAIGSQNPIDFWLDLCLDALGTLQE